MTPQTPGRKPGVRFFVERLSSRVFRRLGHWKLPAGRRQMSSFAGDNDSQTIFRVDRPLIGFTLSNLAAIVCSVLRKSRRSLRHDSPPLPDPSTGRVAPECIAWLDEFRRRHGRAPRLLHIGNIANNAYNNAKLLNEVGLDSDVICHNYYHIMGCPEWEDADFEGDVRDDFYPAWERVRLRGFRRPRAGLPKGRAVVLEIPGRSPQSAPLAGWRLVAVAGLRLGSRSHSSIVTPDCGKWPSW